MKPVTVIVFIALLTFPGCLGNAGKKASLKDNQIISLNNWLYFSDGDSAGSILYSDSLSQKNLLQNISHSDKWIPLNSSSLISRYPNGRLIWIRSILPEWNGTGPALCLGLISYPVQIFLDGKPVFQQGSFTAEQNKYIRWKQNLVMLPYYKIGSEILIKIKLNEKSGEINDKILFGSSLQIFLNLFIQSIPSLIILVFLFLCGLTSISVYLFLERSKLIFGIFLFLFSLGFLTAVNNPFVQLLVDLPGMFYHINYISLQMAGIGFFYIIAQLSAPRYEKITNFIWQLKAALLVVSVIVFSTTSLLVIETMKYQAMMNMILVPAAIIFLLLTVWKDKYQLKVFIISLIAVLAARLLDGILTLNSGIYTSFGNSINSMHYSSLIFVAAVVWMAFRNYRDGQLEKEMIRLNEFEAVKRENETRHLLAAKLLESQETERNRIALELHDSVGQKLLLIKNYMISLIRSFSDNKAISTVLAAGDLTDETIQEIRNITYNLRPQYLDQLGLTAAIESMIEKITKTSGINFIMKIDNVDNLFSKNYEVNFFRIIQEGLNNIVKHSGAGEAFVIIKIEDDLLSLKIIDNGTGFKKLPPPPDTLGIAGMKERARIIGASFDIVSVYEGTSIKVQYPLIREKVYE